MAAELQIKRKPIFSQSTKYYFHSAIAILLMFTFRFIPPFNPMITETGMNALGIFLGVLYGWSFVGMIWPSLLGMIACGFTGIMTLQESFAMGFGSDLAVITIFVFMFAAFMEESGLNSYIANWFISRKIVVGKPYAFLAAMMLSGFVLSCFTQIFAAIVIVWSIFYNVAKEMGLQRREGFVNCTMFGILYSASLGAIVFPFSSFAIIALGLMKKATGLTVNFLTFSLFNLLACSIIMLLYWLACKYLFRPDTQKLLSTEDRFAYMRGVKMNKKQKSAAVGLGIFLTMLFLPGIFPNSSFIINQLKSLGVVGSVLLVMIAFMILRKDGSEGTEGILNFGDIARKGINWQVLVLLASTFPISSALESEQSGVLKAAEAFISSSISDLNPFLAMAFLAILVACLTQFTHNAVLLIIFIPMLCPIVISHGINPIVLVVTLLYASKSALITPAASTQAAMIFANTEWVEIKELFKLAVVGATIMAVVAVAIIPLANIIF
ncbi:citrate transporter [Desulfitobacterium hafniense DP7]|uniref:Citrate transporter n=2 Tax=Desulfitobacterium hafniense TaxID=49338 RepID=A0A098AXQ2_DESHA|nr:SLC13 family permease [Desulfitobacterium hafniense]EHL07970.1 citrate transporter [Desulfitobacterium hafniense DP7]CDX00396.1 Citrate transporter [Desulfitobacterium hafniense]